MGWDKDIEEPKREAARAARRRKPPHGAAALSPKERVLALLLARGRTLPDAAKEMGVKESTVRTHYHSLHKRTGSHTRAQLVRWVMVNLEGLRIQADLEHEEKPAPNVAGLLPQERAALDYALRVHRTWPSATVVLSFSTLHLSHVYLTAHGNEAALRDALLPPVKSTSVKALARDWTVTRTFDAYEVEVIRLDDVKIMFTVTHEELASLGLEAQPT